MKKVKMLESMAGPLLSYSKGQIIELEDKDAISLIKAGIAEGLSPAQSSETRESKTPVQKRKR